MMVMNSPLARVASRASDGFDAAHDGALLSSGGGRPPPRSQKADSLSSTELVANGDAAVGHLGDEKVRLSPPSLPPLTPMAESDGDGDALRAKYTRANALVASVLNKYYNGSARAVDPFVIRCLHEEETRLFSLQCFIEQGPAETARGRKESAAMDSAAQAAPAQTTLLSRFFGICGGYMGGPGSVMREWDAISSHTAGLDDAMRDYVAIVDKVLPGWDRAPPHEYPVAQQHKFWRDDLSADACQSCGAPFSSVHCRRHHCRLCLDIFCAPCCSEAVDMALCPGAPVRRQRVCLPCFEEAEKDRSLLAVRRMIRENHELEQRIKDVATATEALVGAKQKEEAKLRAEAARCGCELDEIDAAIEKQIGSPVAVAVRLPPAHKFAPRATADANEQLALAHRQLLMGLKVAQCRAKKAAEKMDVTLRVLRDAICFGASSSWTVVLRQLARGGLLTLREVRALAMVSATLRGGVERFQCEQKCVLAQDLPAPAWRAFVWQSQWLRNAKTREYLLDLAEAVRARIDSSDTESDDGHGHEQEQLCTVRSVDCLALLGAHLAPSRRSVWKTVYEFILTRCDGLSSASSGLAAAGEFDAQIQGDVGRTFGVSSLRGRAQAPKKTGATANRKAYQRAGASTLETPLALRKTALTNVLRAFASVNSEIGYCQGMDHVAALLLSVVDWNESDAFWMLTSVVVSPQYELEKLYGPGLPHLNMRAFQLEQLLAVHLPELHAHLQELEFPVSMLTTTWFMTLFTNMDALSYDLVLRVLDGFFVSGWKLLFRVALAIMEALQHHMLASAFEEMPQVLYDLHSIAPQFVGVDSHAVLAGAAKFKVTNSQLQRLADEYEQSGGNTGSSSTRSSTSLATLSPVHARSPAHATNGNGQTPGVNVAIISSPRGTMAAASPMATTATVSAETNGVAASNGHGSPRAASPQRNAAEPSPSKRSAPHTTTAATNQASPPLPMLSRRSRNSSSGASTESDSDRKSPDAIHAVSPAALLAPPQRYAMSSSSTIQYGLATPLNANYYF